MKTRKPFAGFTAALVAVCMMLQLIPAFGAMPTAEAAVGDSYTVNFKTDRWKSGANRYYNCQEATYETEGWILDSENTTIDMENENNVKGLVPSGLTLYVTQKGEKVAFKVEVPESGEYKIDATINRGWYYSVFDISIDDDNLGNMGAGIDWSNKSLVEEVKNIGGRTVVLTEGEHTISFSCTTLNGDGKKLGIEDVTFTKVADLATGPVIKFDGLTTDTLNAKKITDDSPWELDSGKTTATGLTVYSGTLADGTTPASYLASTHSNTPLEGGSWNFQTLSFRIKIEEDGLYDLSAITYLAGSEWNRADQIEIRIDGAKTHSGTLSSKVKEGDTAKTLRTYTLNQVALKKGYHNIAIIDGHGSSDKYSLTLNSLILNRVGDITSVTPAVVSDNFGENYAYIRESYVGGTTVYNVIFLGGIDAITDYVEVGFEYSTDGGANWIPAMSNKVYESLEFSDGTLANTDFGTDYIFYSDVEFTGVNASSAVTFRACAEAADGSKIYGAEYTVPVNK